ncbi:hypothetical protein PVAP13_6NG220500 [Panicum virgatum]|uniref:Uncharacterized protein n=1 Tax=Panicum virgatum TaxID=38727 RepID=A0A8T0QXE1_PANVG|nr:hypothetical protein PVAP13_6NG220500 [Panicum virgatum]
MDNPNIGSPRGLLLARKAAARPIDGSWLPTLGSAQEAGCNGHGGAAVCAQEEVHGTASSAGKHWWRPAWSDPVAVGLPITADGGVPAEIFIVVSLTGELVAFGMAGSSGRRTGPVPIASRGRW